MTNTPNPQTQAQITSLQTEISALQSAIISGVTRVSYDGRSVDYDDLQNMKMRLNFATDLLNQLIRPGYRKPQVGRVHFSNGYQYRPFTIYGFRGFY